MICPKCGEWIKNPDIIEEDRVLPDDEAEEVIREVLVKMRDDGQKGFDILDIIHESGLYAEQINRILDKLREEKIKD